MCKYHSIVYIYLEPKGPSILIGNFGKDLCLEGWRLKNSLQTRCRIFFPPQKKRPFVCNPAWPVLALGKPMVSIVRLRKTTWKTPNLLGGFGGASFSCKMGMTPMKHLGTWYSSKNFESSSQCFFGTINTDKSIETTGFSTFKWPDRFEKAIGPKILRLETNWILPSELT